MRNTILILLISSLMIMLPIKVIAQSEATNEINTIMMRNTFKIEGSNHEVGTCFIMTKPSANKEKLYFILITAAHVLEGISGDTATIHLRQRKKDNTFEKILFPIKIKQDNKPLWTKNKNGFDIAVMNVSLPSLNIIDLRTLSTEMLGDDKFLSDFEIHPGDEMYCLGFPFRAEANQAGFPILRSGRIASFPLKPTDAYPTFLLDFKVYPGNSGGPVYFAEPNRVLYGDLHKVQFLAGLVAQEHSVKEEIKSQYEKTERTYPLSLAVIIQAAHIKDTINQLSDLK